ncbi:MAG: beta-propeller domain-containing protein [Xanthomonadales bacterium]|nr:beta-propeller domain-containing protein [Xanthomonadales bacterium]
MNKHSVSLRKLLNIARTAGALAVFVLALVIAAPVVAQTSATSNGITGPGNAEFRAGLWWDPGLSGTGWEINTSGDAIFGIWYTYDDNSNPVWFTTQGFLNDGRFEGNLLSFTWDYNNGKVNEPTVAGNVSIQFLNPQLAEIQWQLGQHQDKHILRPFIFSATPALADYSGSWYDPEESGYGMTIQSQGDLTYAVLYYYDLAGNPRWTAGINAQGSQSLSMLSFKGSCPWCEYAPPTHSPAGELLPEFHSELTLSLKMTLPGAASFWSKPAAQHVMISNPPSGRAHPAAMARIASDEALAYYFKTGYMTGNGYDYSVLCPLPPIVSPAPPPVAVEDSEVLSTTNVQVAGVDEADVVKATRDYLYSLDYPLNDIPLSEDASAWQQSITRYRISANGDVPLGDGNFAVSLPRTEGMNSHVRTQGLYHYDPEPGSDSESARLIYLASQVEGGCGWPATVSTSIRAFDADADTGFVVETELEIEGELIASRKIGDRLFIATTFKPDIYKLALDVLSPEAAQGFSATPANVEALFKLLGSEQLFPAIAYPDKSHQRLVTTDNVMMPPLPLYNVEPVLTTLSMFDLNDLNAPPVSIAVMGRTNGMYATPNNVYFASSNTGYGINEFGEIVKTGFSDTDIHKLAISEDALEYRGSGTVEGSLGNDPERLAFRMSEYQDHLRVVSSQGWRDRWGSLGDHRLTILKESERNNLLLRTVSILPNAQRPEPIGKPDEQIHGVRFKGKRAYVVTFVRVDPLYALDLADPTDPRILGELEIEGFSDYLHPVGDHLLIGIGMQAITPEETGNTWFQGVQVGLFDVTAPTAPVLLHIEEIGQRGTTTSVMSTHRAFTSVPGDPATGEPMRFTIPVSEHGPTDGILNPDPSHWYPWKSTGIVMFDVNERDGGQSTMELTGRANVASADTIAPDDAGFYRYPHQDYSRSVIYGDQVFHYFRGGLFMTGWSGGVFTPADNCALCASKGN